MSSLLLQRGGLEQRLLRKGCADKLYGLTEEEIAIVKESVKE